MASAGREFFQERYEQLGGEVASVQITQSIRVNTLKTTCKELISRLSSKGVVLEREPLAKNAYRVVSSPFSLGAITEYLLGLYALQEVAAQIPVEVLAPRQGELVLDCCAAPGGKSSQIAQLMKNKGRLVCYELKPHRLKSLLVNLERMGVKNAVVFRADVSRVRLLNKEFDKVLVDAPCSGNYVLEKGWFEKRRLEGILRNAQIQRKILSSAVSVARQGGVIVYSTCSLEPEENELVIDWAIRNLPVKVVLANVKGASPGVVDVFGARLHSDVSKCARLWPHKTKTQGFFIAKLVKK
ncbi:RsmB/NOP family class I SAM-dependent RNA methyltransferase [Candidatus Woesearchaeota archaeon]|nr:MAG: RsmB/NOP family class I SAM-dependent RNA methyltransferase [Candidatus Woesearchaeota archaeon]